MRISEAKIFTPKPISHLLLIALMFSILPSMAVAQNSDPLRIFLQKYVGDPPSEWDKVMRYLNAWVDLNGDGKQEAIVYLLGWCGSGGCSTLILEPNGSSYKVITHVTIAKLPIRVLATTSHGWRDLSVIVQGGGIITPYEAGLQFDGKKYPSNPSMPPAQPLRKKNAGEVLIRAEDYDSGRPLYP
jgi:hypothetical protein